MAVTALTKFTQGALVGLPGVALAGVALTQVDVENDDPTDVASWKVDLVYVPPGSVLVAGVLATGDSPSPFASFTPDVPGCYRVVLTVWDSAGMVGTSNVDIRNFGVPDSNGIIYPPYQELPRKLPVLGSGDVGEKPDELNFNQQPYGWDGDGTDGLMLFFMRQVSAAMSALAGETVGIYSLIDNGQTVVIPDDQVMVNIGGLSIGSTPGDGGILDGPGTFVHVDQDRHFAKAKLHPREGLQILSTEMMLTRGTPDLSGTIYGGGMWGPSEMSPQELLAALGEVVPPGHFLVGGNSPMAPASQAQTRDNLDVYTKAETDAAIVAGAPPAPGELGLLAYADPGTNFFNGVAGNLYYLDGNLVHQVTLPALPVVGDTIGVTGSSPVDPPTQAFITFVGNGNNVLGPRGSGTTARVELSAPGGLIYCRWNGANWYLFGSTALEETGRLPVIGGTPETGAFVCTEFNRRYRYTWSTGAARQVNLPNAQPKDGDRIQIASEGDQAFGSTINFSAASRDIRGDGVSFTGTTDVWRVSSHTGFEIEFQYDLANDQWIVQRNTSAAMWRASQGNSYANPTNASLTLDSSSRVHLREAAANSMLQRLGSGELQYNAVAQHQIVANSTGNLDGVAVGANTFVGRNAGANVGGILMADARTMLNVADGATTDAYTAAGSVGVEWAGAVPTTIKDALDRIAVAVAGGTSGPIA